MSGLNAEFQRNLWLEFTRHRLIATPIVLGLIFMLMSSAGLHGKTVADMAMGLYFALMFLWGGHKAAEAVLEEINESTWDFQRLSSQSPWALTWGKLFGSTCYVWYTGLMLLAIYVYGASNITDDYPYSVVMSQGEILRDVFSFILSALICHSVALLSSLQTAQDAGSSRGKLRIINHHAAGLIAGCYFTSLIRAHGSFSSSIHWYGSLYDAYSFACCVALLFFLWFLLGIYRLMRVQLQMRNGPLPWVGFVFFCMALAGGFDMDFLHVDIGSYFAFCMGMVLFYFMLGVESWNGIRYRKLQESLKVGWNNQVLQLFPRWLLTYLMAAAIGLVIIVSNASSHPQISWTAGAVLAFSLRDAGILHYFRLGTSGRRRQSVALLYLFVLYGLIPWLLKLLGMPGLAQLFWPFPEIEIRLHGGGTMAVAMISGVVQAAFVWMATKRHWRTYWQSF